jgi:hypothetical protein
MASPVVVSRIQNRRGTQAQFDALYPPGYDGVGGADINVYTGILLPGELALCTDTRRAFIGNLNGEYVELDTVVGDGIVLDPLSVVLPPAPTFTLIPELTYQVTPFFTLLYSITNSASPDWNTIGSVFSKNGELKITAVEDFIPPPPIPPFPPLTPVTLTDTGTEINLALPADISFIARYDLTATNIEILYMHDFAGSLTFSTSTIRWAPFI